MNARMRQIPATNSRGIASRSGSRAPWSGCIDRCQRRTRRPSTNGVRRTDTHKQHRAKRVRTGSSTYRLASMERLGGRPGV